MTISIPDLFICACVLLVCRGQVQDTTDMTHIFTY